jgi:hypothetical protein
MIGFFHYYSLELDATVFGEIRLLYMRKRNLYFMLPTHYKIVFMFVYLKDCSKLTSPISFIVVD